jgi:hypothetical protein
MGVGAWLGGRHIDGGGGRCESNNWEKEPRI